MSKEERDGLQLVIPRVHRASADDLIRRIVCGPAGESMVSARVSPLGEESKWVVVRIEVDLHGMLDRILVRMVKNPRLA